MFYKDLLNKNATAFGDRLSYLHMQGLCDHFSSGNRLKYSCNDEAVSLDPSATLLWLRTGLTSISQSQASDAT